MREAKIIRYLKETTAYCSKQQLAEYLGVSSRTISTDIKAINQTADKWGFHITHQRGIGYKLEVTDNMVFNDYFQQLFQENQSELLSPVERKTTITLLLLFSNEYVTINQISETLAVSASTIKTDLQQIKKELTENELTLYAKPYYGYKIIGSEEKRRSLILRLLRNDIPQPELTAEYAAFRQSFNEQNFRSFLIQLVHRHGIKMNDSVLDNILLHVILLGFRIKQQNFIKKELQPFQQADSYAKLTKDIANYLAEQEGIQLPENEQIYLSQQLYGKMLAVNEFGQYDKLYGYISQALGTIDEKYHTMFAQDQELKDALTLHVAPLLQRLYTGHQLENPIIEDVYTRYANVFTITFEFIQLISDTIDVSVSKDEMGYLAIYFAASLEKKSQETIRRYKKIAVICATGGGASYFLKTKLEQIFVNAEVRTFSVIEAGSIDDSVDRIISTVPIELAENKVPIIYTQALLTEKEIKKIQKDLLLIQENRKLTADMDNQLLTLFTEQNFLITEATDYLSLLNERGKRLEALGEAASGYTELVLQREQLVDTIYQNGIAGPHPMEARAVREGIDVILLRPAATFKEKQIKLVFLINISNGHLFLHKEISRLMIRMIDDQALEKQLENIKNYQDFSRYLREIIKKG
ncbi:BglG family transcription antiterminator [Enterococcus sp. BWR-S5]|uniref:BglG family transcription antiterminator n=1 Tax=Enterococcus sp. BWR-S5 TaxID=2787714 RepID=UPI0019224AB5|nr:BglG family transcription antiterminator [Enterococcus sp. BWR-S5]MBL1227319.1 BglG family transcription antiterminator [Enterococcus sp. BWR-S5]